MICLKIHGIDVPSENVNGYFVQGQFITALPDCVRVTKAVSQRMKPYEAVMFKKINTEKGRKENRKERNKKRGWWGVGGGGERAFY